MSAKPIPEGYHSLTPYIFVDGAAEAIEFYKKAFGAEEVLRMPLGDKIGHAEVKIGDSHLMLADEFPEMDVKGPKSRGGVTSSLMIYVEDVDAAFQQAIDAGGTVEKAVQDQFYGDRSGTLIDPFGHKWTLATHIEDLTVDQVAERLAAMGQT